MALKKEEFIIRSNSLHNEFYDYSKINFKNTSTKVEIICPLHGVFSQTPRSHMTGSGCPKCGRKNAASKNKKSPQKYISECAKKHSNKYDYTKTNYINSYTNIDVICPKHGLFSINPSEHLRGVGCSKCGFERSKKAVQERYNNVSTRQENFIENSNNIHKNKYSYDDINYTDNATKISICCPIHGDFTQIPYNHIQGVGCPKCAKIQSKPETEIIKYIKSLGIHEDEIIQGNRTLLEGKEIDIYLPKYNLGIEYNGLLWHSRGYGFPSTKGKDRSEYRDKHLYKTDKAQEKGVNVLHIFENEWLNEDKKEKWKSVIRNKLHKNQVIINGRDTIYREISSKEANKFNSMYHLQGETSSKYNLGLYYKGELVSVMTLSNARFTKDPKVKFELIRFCSKFNHQIRGGASKLLKNFMRSHDGGIVSYANRRWSDGNLYRALGFHESHISPPNYFYFKKDNILWSRNKYQKHKLHKVLEVFDKNKTEEENMFINGYRQIFDSGNYVFILM